MKQYLVYILFLCCIISCKEKVKSPLKATNDYCHFIEAEKSNNSNFVSLLDSLTIEDKTGVFVLEKGVDAITSRANLSQNATETMDIQYFIFSEDNIGVISCDYMLRAACRGVKVRILVDDLLIDANYDHILAIEQHKNIELKIYNPNINIGKNLASNIYTLASDFRGINQRMHHKTFIVDRKIAITGGRNIADEYFDFDHEYNFRDRDVLLLGGKAHDVQHVFDQYWNSELSVPISELIEYSSSQYDPAIVYKYIYEYAQDSLNFWPNIRAYIPYAMNDILQSDNFVWLDSLSFVSDMPGKNNSTNGLIGGGATTSALIDLVINAKESIYIQSPYLVVSDLGYELFKNAVNKGVEVNILTNSLASTDNLEAFNGYQRNRKRLINAGINLYEYRPDAKIRKELMEGNLQKKMNFTPIFGLHAKSMIIDNSISVIGTFNLDPRSANLNTECITILHSKEINRAMSEVMRMELQKENAWHVTKEFNPDEKAGNWKLLKAWTKGIIPTSIL